MSILRKGFLRVLILCLLILSVTGCSSRGSKENSITIAEQYGLAYAPLQIMRLKGFLEEQNPDADVSWVTLGNTAAIREAVLAGDVDAGFLGIPPFLIAYDKGMNWKIATGLSRSPLALVVNDKLIGDERDFGAEKQLALPQPGSIQHILLSMAMEEKYGDPRYLDNSLVAMKHPDGMNALLSGAVAGHFTSPPYLFKELDQDGFSLLVYGDDAMGGPFTFIAGMVTDDFYEENPDLYHDYLKAIDKSIEFIERNRAETIEILSGEYNLEPEFLSEYLYERGIVFSREILGLDRFIDFMKKTDMISADVTAGGVLVEGS